MAFIIGIIIFTSLVLVFAKYLKCRFFKNNPKIIIVIILFNLVFYGGIIIIGMLIDIKNENDFNNNIQIYSKDHPDYGLLKNYESLTDEDRQIYDYYIGDGGRNIFMFIIIPILFIIYILFILLLYFLLEIKYFKRKYINNKNDQ